MIGTDTQMVRASLYAGLAILDVLAVIVGFALSDLIRHGDMQDLHSASYWLIVPTFLTASFYVRAYSYTTLIARHVSIWKAISAMLAATAITVMLLFALKNSGDVSRVAFFMGMLLGVVGLVLIRLPAAAAHQAAGVALLSPRAHHRGRMRSGDPGRLRVY